MNEIPNEPRVIAGKVRRAPRRAVRVACEVVSHYSDEPAPLTVTNLSPYGMWLETPLPLHLGAEVVVSFSPPRWRGRELMVFGRVARINSGRRRRDRGSLGMGVEFADLTAAQTELMRSCLRGLPASSPAA